MNPATIVRTREDLADFAQASSYEWLLSNGLGSYAAGTVSGACTRRYHGWLVTALDPPVQRTVMVAKCDVTIEYRGHTYALSSNEYGDGTIDPQGYRYLECFRLDSQMPVWIWSMSDLCIRQRLWMLHGEHTVYAEWTVLRAGAPITLSVTPLCTYRDYHSETQGGWTPAIAGQAQSCIITAAPMAQAYQLTSNRGIFKLDPVWYWNVKHRLEAERGLDAREDLFRPGRFEAIFERGESMTLTLATNVAPVPAVALAREEARQAALVTALPNATPAWITQLALAADQFIVKRGGGGATVLAGYPWFTDWGRDTMIALPGLTIPTRRTEVAAQILRSYATHLSDGMLPNRFPDTGSAPEFNTVDATLWYFVAIDEYLQATDDWSLVRDLYPALQGILDWHVRGTRFGIHIDPNDGLLAAGVSGVQLTWMDARVGDWVVTPRHGKAVEINALWQRALCAMQRFAAYFDYKNDQVDFARRAALHAYSFDTRFWNPTGGYLFDVIDGPDNAAPDASVRPNQLCAVALTDTLLDHAQRRAVVDRCIEDLWTPHGLRTLARTDPRYQGVYRGGPHERDSAYHQGTVWPWLLGPLTRAHFMIYRDKASALALIEPLAGHLNHACLGTLSEIFDGDEPNLARGCFAQAWSVAAILSAWHFIETQDASSNLGVPI